MKKLILLAFVLFTMNGFSQKKLSIYNYSSYQQKVYQIYTKPTSGTFPYFYINGSALGFQPGDSCLLENLASTTKFPFKSTVAPTYIYPIQNWWRQTSATAKGNFTSLAAWNLAQSASQSFNYVDIGGIVGKLGVAPYNTNIPRQTPTWEVYYDRIPISATNYEDVVAFFDL